MLRPRFVVLVCLAALGLAGCAAMEPSAPAAPATPAAAIDIPLEILKPGGAGPFPAVVMLHDCSGLGPRSSGSPRRWAKLLVEWGYVVAIPDSLSTRGFASGVFVAESAERSKVGPLFRARDAYEALRRLRALPYVDAARIGVMGGSHGGATTIAALADAAHDSPAMKQAKRAGFRAGIALYPSCTLGRPRFDTEYKAVAPLLVLAGELDDWTPAAPCQRLAAVASKEGAPVRTKVYPNAHHSFDNDSPQRYVARRNNVNAPGGKGATTGGNPEAWADSIREVKAFFASHLQGAAAR
jgi:dienelactone hydrolase